MNDHYLELLRNAKDALGDLLRETEPGTGLILHQGYAHLKGVVERATAAPSPAPARDDDRRRRDDLGDRWRRMNWDDRHRTILAVLGDRRLTTREIAEKLNATGDWEFYGNDTAVVGTVRHLWKRGDLDRAPEEWRGRTRYRYFHRTQLEGPIADLQSVLDAGVDGPAA